MIEAIILLGAPGAGKGTTADDLKAAETDLAHLSTGNLLRESIRAGHPVGLEARSYMEKGELVPDAVIMRIVRGQLDAGGSDRRYIFDGFPRTQEQARLLDELLAEADRGRVAHVFLLDVPQDVLVDRIAGRRICRDCGAVFHIRNIPPRVEGVCDACGGALHQRADDDRATVLNRLEVFRQQTESLIEYYDRKGVLRRISARDRETTRARILDHMRPDAGPS